MLQDLTFKRSDDDGHEEEDAVASWGLSKLPFVWENCHLTEMEMVLSQEFTISSDFWHSALTTLPVRQDADDNESF